MTLELGSTEWITLTCCARPRFPFALNSGLELNKPTKKPLQYNIGRKPRQVSKQCDPSWVSLIVACTSPKVISPSPPPSPKKKKFLMSSIEYSSSEFPQKLHVDVEQVKNRIHQPNSKIHYLQAISHWLLSSDTGLKWLAKEFKPATCHCLKIRLENGLTVHFIFIRQTWCHCF